MSLPVGILSYGSNDPSIILKCSLRSRAAVAAPEIGSAGTITNASTARFDANFGFRPGETGNSGITFASVAGFQALDNCGQVSFDINREILCVDTRQSIGTNPSVQWTFVASNGTNYAAIRKIGGVPPPFGVKMHDAGDTQGLAYFHSDGKAEFVRVCLSWNAGSLALFVDGKRVNHWQTAPTRITRWVNQFQNICCMSFTSGGSPNRDGFMRDLLVSREPVHFFTQPEKRFAFLGHSFATTYTNDTTPSGINYDNSVGGYIRQHFNRSAFDVGIEAFGVGGGYWDPAITAFDIGDYAAATVAAKPNYIVCYGGTNDVGGGAYNDAGYLSGIQTALGIIASDAWAPKIERIVFMTTPSRSGIVTSWNDATRANILSSNAVIQTLPAWWNGTYPALAGKLVTADLFNAWGGMYPPRPVMGGQRSGAFDDLHPSSLGCKIIADLALQSLGF